MDIGFGNILTKKQAKNRLVSFFFIKEQKTASSINTYITSGKISNNKKSKS